MWCDENRGRYDRSKLRYPSDLTDEEWALISPQIPPARKGGANRTVYDYFGLWDRNGTLMRIHHVLSVDTRRLR
jgi:hypothetical protein